jgi:hypothetical protein
MMNSIGLILLILVVGIGAILYTAYRVIKGLIRYIKGTGKKVKVRLKR